MPSAPLSATVTTASLTNIRAITRPAMRASTSLIYSPLSQTQARHRLPELIALLQDAVESGASIGFLPPLSPEAAAAYWRAIFSDLGAQSRVLVAAMARERLVGAVQLELAAKPNARHRAEVQKLLVLRSHRRRGIGERLMQAAEREAQGAGRRLLVLDTRQGDTAERLYRRLGFQEAGIIPHFARNGEGGLDATVIFYKLLGAQGVGIAEDR